MIIKYYEINQVNLDKVELILLYGKNEGLKSKITNDILNNKDEIIDVEQSIDVGDIGIGFATIVHGVAPAFIKSSFIL